MNAHFGSPFAYDTSHRYALTHAIKKSDLYFSLWASCNELRGGMDASVIAPVSAGRGVIIGPLDDASASGVNPACLSRQDPDCLIHSPVSGIVQRHNAGRIAPLGSSTCRDGRF